MQAVGIQELWTSSSLNGETGHVNNLSYEASDSSREKTQLAILISIT